MKQLMMALAIFVACAALALPSQAAAQATTGIPPSITRAHVIDGGGLTVRIPRPERRSGIGVCAWLPDRPEVLPAVARRDPVERPSERRLREAPACHLPFCHYRAA